MERLFELVEKFNKKALDDEKLKQDLKGLEKKIEINFTDDGNYSFILKDGQLSRFNGKFDRPDITVLISTDIFNSILNKELDVLSAYITRKFTVKASLSDKLLISELLK
ncbi:MAG: SCP2 sterol-binding domain-containing protein [Thermoplasmata archaeon]